MNYYLARDGQTYGPYPQESFPSMLQQGQVVQNDLVCPEGGTDWVALSTVPALSGAAPAKIAGLVAPPVASSSKMSGTGPAMPVVAASSSSPVAMPAVASSSSSPVAMPATGQSRLRISGATAKPHAEAAAAPMPAAGAANYPKATYAQDKPSLMARAAGAWGLLRIVGGSAVAIIVVVGLLIGFFRGRGDRKEIAKLHSHPGWTAFNAGNSQINSVDSIAGYGSSSETKIFAEKVAEQIEILQRTSFPPPRRTRYRGRSKLGRITSAVNSASSGTGEPQVYAEKHGSLFLALIHVPELSRYSSSSQEALGEACWEATHGLMTSALKMAEQARALSGTSRTPTNRTARAGATRPPGRTVQPPPAAAAAAAPPKVDPPKPPPEFTLVVAVRGKSAYESVYVGKAGGTSGETKPTVINGNVPSHQELMKWFDPELWKSDYEKPKSE